MRKEAQGRNLRKLNLGLLGQRPSYYQVSHAYRARDKVYEAERSLCPPPDIWTSTTTRSTSGRAKPTIVGS